ncbi:MAG: electron transfer flavoprotein subunit alpha/FixB family protein [Cyanobacteria bacterium SIG29]|nr:electron transfer flavoprotein subunit alpha/FixB family protein [Cyanobacteria bacterium SIG29]
MTEPNGILIYGELNKDNSISNVVLELLTKSRELKSKIWNQRIMVCVIGKRQNYDNIVKTLGEYGANEVVIVNDDRLKDYNKTYHSEIFTNIAKKYPPRIILIGATQKGKEIAPFVATKLETGLTADCTNLDIGENNLLLSTRPTFGGQLTADILCKTFPQMATVQANTFKKEQCENNVKAIFNWIDIDKIENKIEAINIIEKANASRDINTAKIIVAGGKGACKDNGFTLIYELAQKLNAAVAGTREAFEMGYITKSQQIGQTGKTVAPQLYIAVGISGANQHLAGIKNSDKIIAINNDKNAPIFKHSDVGIVGDLFKVLEELINNIDK